MKTNLVQPQSIRPTGQTHVIVGDAPKASPRPEDIFIPSARSPISESGESSGSDVAPEAKATVDRTWKQFFAAPFASLWGAIKSGGNKIAGASKNVASTTFGAVKSGASRIAQGTVSGWNNLRGVFFRKTKEAAANVEAKAGTQEAKAEAPEFAATADAVLPKAS